MIRCSDTLQGRFRPRKFGLREVQQLIELMRETMHNAPGVGLAAPQIGLPLQLAVIQDTGGSPATERTPVDFHVIANPRLTLGDGMVEFFEGCLSVEGFQAVVPRARSVRVEALDHRGEPVVIDAAGWYARILQHEIDHLNGKLYIDQDAGRYAGDEQELRALLGGRSDRRGDRGVRRVAPRPGTDGRREEITI